jgi:hypothetical protein
MSPNGRSSVSSSTFKDHDSKENGDISEATAFLVSFEDGDPANPQVCPLFLHVLTLQITKFNPSFARIGPG